MSNGQTVVVTGGAGYIGSHTVHQLTEQGYEVVVVDNLSTGHKWAVPHDVTLYRFDAADQARMTEVLQRHTPRALIHFAGHIVVPESVADPVKYYRNNVVTSLNLIDACRKSAVNEFVFSSSAAVYGVPPNVPVTEESPTEPINPYGRTKLITEWTLADVANSCLESPADTRFRYIALRYFNVAGARLDGTLGQATPEATHLIKVACETACGDRSRVEIFGTDYDTRDGTCIRDYIHVEDLATAHLDALRYLRGGGESAVLNCGYGRGYSVREILESVQRASGVNFEVVESPRRPGDPPELIADSARARDLLDWSPRFDAIEQICGTAFQCEKHLKQRKLGR
jgi:UDP-glucose 4-epimerase